MYSRRLAESASFCVALVALEVLAVAGCSARSPRYRPYANNGGNRGNGGPVYVGGPQPTHAQPGQQAQPVQPVGPAAGGGTGGPVNTMIQNADRALRAQGYQPIAAPMTQTIQPHGLLSFPLLARPGACYAVFAIGGAGVGDVDMTVISPNGATLGSDTNTDIHPHVEFCAYEAGLHLARVNMFAGGGNVVFAAYQGPTGSSANLAGVFDGATPGPQVAQLPRTPDAATGARIQRLRAQLSAAGYADIQPVAAEPVPAGDTLSMNAQLPGGLCYAFATFGGPGVTDSDVFLFDATGSRQVAGDAATDVDAQIRDICPAETAAYQIRVRLFSGSGPVWLLAMSRPNAAAGTPAQSSPLAINVRQSAGGGGMDGAFNRLSREMQSRGYAPPSAPIVGQLATAATAVHPVSLQAGTCYAIAAIGDSTVQHLDLAVQDAAGTLVDQNFSNDAAPSLRVCPTAAGQYSLHVAMVAGQGDYRLAVFPWSGGTSGAGMTGVLFLRNAEVTRVLQADTFVGDPDFELVRARIQEGHSTTRSATLHANTCYAFVAVGGAGVGELGLTVQQGHTTRAQGTELTAFPVARFCAQSAGAYSVVIRSAHGNGEYVFRVFRQQTPGQN